ncbi:single-stranded-DNA-specific exonuclease RecJ [Halobacteriovorax sp. DPLXC-1]|uniref:single-stranded-DNA-specific exonuclease RecJ n=1 Tax=unclassified Halobacteriovorax TaxID=2639665 RepID=UPI002FF42907
MENTTHTSTENTFNLHPVVQRLLNKKGMSHEDIREFLSWDLKALPNFGELIDIDVAANEIIKSLDAGEKIAIYGDYDVDGTTSCALFYQFFQKLNREVELIQPSRFIEGYGLHNCSIDRAIEDGIDLMITVDCGISNVEAAAYAKEKGLKLIITDHHKDGRETMPDAVAVVNPSRRDEPADSDMKPLAGVGVAFAICVEIRKILLARGEDIPSVYDLLQYVAIGTICDLAPLTPMNMKLVRHGMKLIKNTQYEGIKAFFDPTDRSKDVIPSEKLSFNVGPLINSKGRLDHPEIALKLLISKDYNEAREYYHQLVNCNTERKAIQKEVFEEAQQQVIDEIKRGGGDHDISIVYAPHFHEGVIGIVASKLVETFKVPAIVFSDAEDEGVIKASARSAGELDIYHLLNEHRDFFLKFGGHKAAAGLSMKQENYEAFKQSMNEKLRAIPLIQRTVQNFYDLEISPNEIDPALLRGLDALEPYGMGNAKPIFKLKGAMLKSYDLLKDVHVRWNFTSITNQKINLKGISFNYMTKWGALTPNEIFERQADPNCELEVYFTLALNYFNGNKYIQLMVDRIEMN